MMKTAKLAWSSVGMASTILAMPEVIDPPANQPDQPSPFRRRRRLAMLLVALLLTVSLLTLVPLPLPVGTRIIFDTPGTTVTKGATWSSKVLVTTEEAVNAADVTVVFPADTLQLTDIDTTGTAFEVVLFEPRVDNTVGTIRFLQATPRSFEGDAGLLGIMTFKALAEGDVRLEVGTAKVTSADGQARNTYSPSQKITIWQWLRLKTGI